jgi:hypothetical protein
VVVEASEAAKAAEAAEVNEAVEVLRPGKSLLRTPQSSFYVLKSEFFG